MAEQRLVWEDLTEGDEAVSGGRTVTEADVVNFAGLSGDFNWFHIDAVAARESVFGQRVAHGMLVLSIATGLQVGQMEPRIATAAFMGLREWQFRAPVFFGDTIRVVRRIGEKSEHKSPEQGLVVYEIEIRNQDDKVVQKGQWNMLVRRRAPVEAAAAAATGESEG
jgi:acyl dehydratase